MEMDSSSRGRPFDRSSRDPAAMKKPRLLKEERPFIRSSNNNISNGGGGGGGRPVVQRQPAVGFRPAAERDRDSENSDSTRGGGGYHPQALSQSQLQQQHQELVNQYRTALAELTFNSKPIITNLTIIAGENVHAAKAIAATICSNILEVPSDQKLPSLYLLDSIVKNIGRDYIKYFAARLPEVFCKAYRQVDPAVHSGMRHLFGTWKGVFPPQSLQHIEKELGFQSATNESSSFEPDPQPQRPARSIHVNPKYLEARRQRLQQSSVVKGPTSETNLINSPEDADRQDRPSVNITSVRPQTNPRLKNIQQAQRNVVGAIRENERALYNDFDSSEIVNEQGFGNSLYGPGSNSTETILGHTNGFDMKHEFPNFSAKRYANADVKSQPTTDIAMKRSGELNRSWKNLEEEEYMWDGLNSRLPNSVRSGGSSKRDPRSHLEHEKLGFEDHLQKSRRLQDMGSRVDREASSDSLTGDYKDGGFFRQQMPSVVRSEGLPFNGVSTSVNSILKSSLQPQIGSSHVGASGLLGFSPSAITGQQLHTPGAASPTLHRPPAPSFSTHNSSRILHNFAGQDGKPPLSRGQKKTGVSSQSLQDSFHMGNSQKSQMQLSLQTKKHGSSQSPATKISADAKTLIGPSSDHIKSPITDTLEPLTTGNLLASVSIFGSNSESNSRPSIPSAPPPTQFTSSDSKVKSPHMSSSSHDSILLSASTLQREADLPPVSSLLSTLVAKGLISASKADSPSDQTLIRSGNPKTDAPVAPAPVPEKMKLPLTNDEPSPSNSAVKCTLDTEDVKSVIGFEFKPDVIRRSHPSVISQLIIDELPHQCHICGLRFKLVERFDRHIEWHTLNNPELNTPNKASRRWFTKFDDWSKEKPEAQSGDQTTGPVQIDGEPMVVADESQCVCILCGDVFDDFYYQEMGKWMFRRAVYLNIKDENIGDTYGPIVHAHCISENSFSDLGLSNDVKREGE